MASTHVLVDSDEMPKATASEPYSERGVELLAERRAGAGRRPPSWLPSSMRATQAAMQTLAERPQMTVAARQPAADDREEGTLDHAVRQATADA